MVVVVVVVCSSVTRMPLHMCCTVATRNALHCKVCVLKTRPASNKIIKLCVITASTTRAKLFAESACRSQAIETELEGFERKIPPIETAEWRGRNVDEKKNNKLNVELSNEKHFCKLEGTAERLLGLQLTLPNLALYYGALVLRVKLFYVHSSQTPYLIAPFDSTYRSCAS